MDWLIVTPAWGDRHVELFVNVALPAIMTAAARISGKVRFIIHTDDPGKIKQAIGRPPHIHKVLPIPKGQKTTHVRLGECHRGAIAHAKRGECIAFINADMVPSIEVFEAAEKRFAKGKRVIMMAGTRTLGNEPPPIGVKSAVLLRWTMSNRHPIIAECFWGSGRAVGPWAIYFQRGDDIVLHGFHLHPFAVMKDRELTFRGKTIDDDLANNFRRDETHLVTAADEAAFAEVSPPAPILHIGDVLNVETAVRWAKGSATSVHRWFFGQRIAICGDGSDIGDGEVCEEILRRL